MNDDDKLAELLGFTGNGSKRQRLPAWGKVSSVDDDYANVVIWSNPDGTQSTVRAVRCCNASEGDVVALECVDGRYRAVATKGGGSSYVETDPTVPSWAKQPSKPDYDFSEIKNATPISIDYINSL